MGYLFQYRDKSASLPLMDPAYKYRFAVNNNRRSYGRLLTIALDAISYFGGLIVLGRFFLKKRLNFLEYRRINSDVFYESIKKISDNNNIFWKN